MGLMEKLERPDAYAQGQLLAGALGHVGVMIFNHPERLNAMTVEMWMGMGEVMDRFSADPAIRVVVIAGAGEKAFVSGGDISQFEAHRADAAAVERMEKMVARGRTALARLGKPSIACIQGYCLGGGLAIALEADMRIAGGTARFGIPAAKLGIAYHPPSLRKLVSLVGPSRARIVMYTGRQFSAQEALAMGLVDVVTEPDALVDHVLDLAQTIAGNAPLAVRAAQFTIAQMLLDPADRDMARVAELGRECFDSADYREGRTAFMEKRKPVFNGN